MRAIVYVDGFNLYYGALKATPYRWLDLEALCTRLLPRDEISLIRYFTAPVTARPSDPDQPQRQQTYLRALRTSARLSIHLGEFRTRRVRMARAQVPHHTVQVLKTEEKGSGRQPCELPAARRLPGALRGRGCHIERLRP
jgi:hypothetical protein